MAHVNVDKNVRGKDQKKRTTTPWTEQRRDCEKRKQLFYREKNGVFVKVFLSSKKNVDYSTKDYAKRGIENTFPALPGYFSSVTTKFFLQKIVSLFP